MTNSNKDAADRYSLGFPGLHVFESNRFDLVRAVDGLNNRVELEGNLIFLKRLGLHSCAGSQLIPTVHHRDRGAVVGQEHGLLHRGVPAANDHNGLVTEKEPVTGGAVRHPVPGVLFLTRNIQSAVTRPGRDNDRAALVSTLIRHDSLNVAAQVQLQGILIDDFNPETFGLIQHFLHQVRALNPVFKPGIVFHQGRVHQHPADIHRPCHQQRFQG